MEREELELKYRSFVGEKYPENYLRLINCDIETFAIEFAEHLLSLTAPEEDKEEKICYNGKPCVENCNLDNCPVTGKWQD